MITTPEIEDFFNRYASTMNNALFGGVIDTHSFTDSFASYVVSANSLGVMGGKNDDELAQSIKSGIDFYKRIGIISMNLIAKDVTILNGYHALVKIQWESIYNKKDHSGEIAFEVIYLVQVMNHVIKIFSYVSGDEQKALKEHGLIP